MAGSISHTEGLKPSTRPSLVSRTLYRAQIFHSESPRAQPCEPLLARVLWLARDYTEGITFGETFNSRRDFSCWTQTFQRDSLVSVGHLLKTIPLRRDLTPSVRPYPEATNFHQTQTFRQDFYLLRRLLPGPQFFWRCYACMQQSTRLLLVSDIFKNPWRLKFLADRYISNE